MRVSVLTGFVHAILFTVLSNSVCGQINWMGGDDAWNVGSWNDDLFANEAFGRSNGLAVGSGELSNIVNIVGGNVTYDPNEFGDFRFAPGAPVDDVRPPGGILNITNGSLSMNTDSDVDGKWTQFDGDELNLDGGTFQRTNSGSSESGGAFILGSWRSYDNQVIRVNLVNGSTIDNSGQMWFGAWDEGTTEHGAGLSVKMTINDGKLDLKGGLDFSFGPNGADADLVIISGWIPDGDTFDGSGVPKNEKHAINFTGPGEISVSDAGIVLPVQDEFGEFGDSDITLVSYQDLWNRGILQAHGFSGAKGAQFDGFFDVEGAVGDESYVLTSKVVDPVSIVWDGGDGAWNDASGKWNGGQTAEDVIGSKRGLEIGKGEIGFDININDGLVTYDPNEFGDFRFVGGGTLNLNGGSLTMNTASDADGKWSELDADAINISNGTLSRTHSDPSKAGGAMILGSWRSYEDQLIEISLSEGGKIENDGQLWFGSFDGDNAPGLEVVVTINDGSLDLTGGNKYDIFGNGEEEGGPGNADLIFFNGLEDDAPKDENYVINFTGPGTITVDSAGITNPVQTGDDPSDPASYGDSFDTLLSYEDLWEKGILQADGMSGVDGMTFGDFFSTTGAPGSDDYTLTSLLDGLLCDPNSRGDLDGNGKVEFADFLVLSGNFGQEVAGHAQGDIDCNGKVEFADFLVLSGNFGQDVGRAEAIPEPSSALLMSLACLAAGAYRRRRA